MGEVIGADPDIGEVAKAGVDPVDGIASRKDLLDCVTRRLDPRTSVVCELDRGVAQADRVEVG